MYEWLTYDKRLNGESLHSHCSLYNSQINSAVPSDIFKTQKVEAVTLLHMLKILVIIIDPVDG